jgi:Ca2+-binding EF-hand superfamily protein
MQTSASAPLPAESASTASFVTARIPLDSNGALAERQRHHEEEHRFKLRVRVEDCLLQREQTLSTLTSWLLALYRVQSKIGSKYSGGGQSASTPNLRSWQTLSSSTRDDHLMKLALMIAALRLHTCELVEALAEWRAMSPRLHVITGTGKEVHLDRPFTWRGRWWPLQLCLDPPLLPLPLPCDPLLLRWFDTASVDGGFDGGGGGGLAHLWASLDPATAPVGLLSPTAWHPPALLQRMRHADVLLRRELEMLDLHPAAMLRARHAAPAPGVGAKPAWSVAAPWTQDGAATQMANLIYGGVRHYTTAVRALFKQVEAVERARAEQQAAATKMQSVIRGRASRRTTSSAAPPQKKSLSGAADLNKVALRSEGGGRYAGTAMKTDGTEERKRNLTMARESTRAAADAADAVARQLLVRAETAEAEAAAATARVLELVRLHGRRAGENVETDEAIIEERRALGIATEERRLADDAAAEAARKRRAADKAAAEAQTVGEKSVQTLLREALTQNATRVSDLFREWDNDGNGTISKREFRAAIAALGYGAPRAEVDKLFDELDSDGSGLIAYRELVRVLRRGAGDEIEISAELQAGAVEFDAEGKNRFALREHARDGARARAGIVATIPALKEALDSNLMRVVDLMRALDVDEDGTITKEEFRKVLPMLGFDGGGTEALDALFDQLDADLGGTIDYEELHRLLRKELA